MPRHGTRPKQDGSSPGQARRKRLILEQPAAWAPLHVRAGKKRRQAQGGQYSRFTTSSGHGRWHVRFVWATGGWHLREHVFSMSPAMAGAPPLFSARPEGNGNPVIFRLNRVVYRPLSVRATVKILEGFASRLTQTTISRRHAPSTQYSRISSQARRTSRRKIPSHNRFLQGGIGPVVITPSGAANPLVRPGDRCTRK